MYIMFFSFFKYDIIINAMKASTDDRIGLSRWALKLSTVLFYLGTVGSVKS